MGTLRGKYTENKWKSKLKIVQAEKKAAIQSAKRYKEQEEKSKLEKKKWKKKSKKLESENKELKSEIEGYKKEKTAVGHFFNSVKPNGHKYMTWVIMLALRLQVMHGLSYRQTSKCLSEIFECMELEMSTPCPSTIRQWGQKQGVYELKKASEQPELEAQVLIIDESAGIGQEKAFLVLGVKIEQWKKKTKSLEYCDTQVLRVATKKSWTGDGVKEVLNSIKEARSGKIKYVISDGAVVMRNGCELSDLIRVSDCTHWMANCMERYYKKDENYQELQKHLGKVRQKMVNGSNVWMIAPSLRSKARFLNLFGIVEWMEKIERVWESLAEEEKKVVDFIKEQPELVKELICIIRIVKELSKFLKTKGITKESAKKVREIFKAYSLQTQTVKRFEADMLKYIKETRDALPNEKTILCCSDVIESYFGKLKYRGNKAASQGITEDILVLPLFNNRLTESSVLKAMESTSWYDVGLWTAENTVDSFSKTKQKAWRKLVSKIA
jgi:hypothetical protein